LNFHPINDIKVLMERDESGRLVLVDETDMLNSFCVIPLSNDIEEQNLLQIVSEAQELPVVLSAIHSEILMHRIKEALRDPLELPSVKVSAQELLDSLASATGFASRPMKPAGDD
jgi:hypothetical protein